MHQRPRGTQAYTKQPLDPDHLLRLLISRGLEVPDHDKALRHLRHIGYYRLSAYTIPFQDGSVGSTLRAGTTFDELLDLYVFDRELRLLVMDALERIEVAIRAALSDHMANRYSGPHWYLDPSRFADRRKHRGLIDSLDESCARQLQKKAETPTGALAHRSALEHYLTRYGSPALPPSWLMVEMLTVGQLSLTYQNLRQKSDKNAIAGALGLNAPLLGSWLSTYARVRNVCAHHGRLWNLGLGVYPSIPTSSKVGWLELDGALPDRSRQRLYPVLVSLQTVLGTIAPRSGWAGRLHALVETRPPMNLAGMGVPEGWSEDPFWSRRLQSR